MKNLQAHLALLFAAIIYGVNYFISKAVVPEPILPYAAILFRVFFGGVLFFIVHRFSGNEKLERKDLIRLIFCAVFGVAINQLMFFKGLSITTEVNAALIMTTSPILVMVLSAFILKERVTVKKVLGILCGAIGAILLIGGKNFEFSSSTIWGDVFVFINALSYGVYLVLVKPLMNKYKPITVIRYAFIFGLFMVVPFGFPEFLEIEITDLTPRVIWSLVFIIVGTTFLAYLLNAWALKRVNPSVVGFYIYLQPILAASLTLLLGRDIDVLYTAMLGALIFAGVYLVSN